MVVKTVIDELSLKIDIKTKKDIDKTISSIASAINKLNKAVSNVSALKKYVNTLNSLTRRTFKVSGGTSKAKAKETTSIKAPETEEVTNINAVSEANKDIVEEKKQAVDLTKEEAREQKRLAKLAEKEKKNQDALNKKAKNTVGPIAKMVKSIGRIAFYRAARFALNQIVQGAAKGLENIRSVDTELDTSMKKMSQSYTSLQNSFAQLLSPIIKTLEPVVTKIADTIANITNNISEARAALSGATTYTKILTSDSEEYKKNLEDATATLLEFDKFSSLTQEKKGYTGTIEAEVDMTKEEAQGIVTQVNLLETALWGIVAVITAIQALKFFNTITNITQALKGMKASSKQATDALKSQKTATTALAISGVAILSTGIVSLISNWEEMGRVGRWLVPILSLVAGAITAIAVAIHFGKGSWGRALAIGSIVTGAGLSVGSALSAATGFADGGTPKQGTYFYAGEAGAEIVANTSGGKTGVTNIAQFKTAMVQALSEYGAARNGRTSDTVLQVNGKEFARATANDMASALSQKYRVDFQPR